MGWKCGLNAAKTHGFATDAKGAPSEECCRQCKGRGMDACEPQPQPLMERHGFQSDREFRRSLDEMKRKKKWTA